jgi:hypothetical protein
MTETELTASGVAKCMQAQFGALKRVFEKLPIEQWADCADWLSGVDRGERANGGRS